MPARVDARVRPNGAHLGRLIWSEYRSFLRRYAVWYALLGALAVVAAVVWLARSAGEAATFDYALF